MQFHTKTSFGRTLILCAVLTATLGCDRHWYHGYHDYKPVSLRITVVDSAGKPRQGIVVRILDAWNEWSDDVRAGKEPWASLTSDDRGRAFFDSEAIAASQLGFRERPEGTAVLSSDYWRNEAEFRVEVGTPTLGWIEEKIPIHYRDSHLDIEIEL